MSNPASGRPKAGAPGDLEHDTAKRQRRRGYVSEGIERELKEVRSKESVKLAGARLKEMQEQWRSANHVTFLEHLSLLSESPSTKQCLIRPIVRQLAARESFDCALASLERMSARFFSRA